MDTKLKSKLNKKACALVFVTLFFFVLGVTAVFFRSEIDNRYGDNINKYIVQGETVRYAKNLNRFYIYFQNFDSDVAYDTLKQLKSKITEKYDVAVENNLTTQNNANNNDYDNEPEAESADYHFEKSPESYYQNIDLNSDSKEYLLGAYNNLSDVYENYSEVKEFLRNETSFQYRIENKKTKEIYSNDDDIENTSFYFKFMLDDSIFNDEKFNGEFLSDSFEKNALEGYIIVPTSINDITSDVYREIKGAEQALNIRLYLDYAILAFISLVVVLVVFIVAKERKSVYEVLKPIYNKYKNVPLIVKIILFFVAIGFMGDFSGIWQYLNMFQGMMTYLDYAMEIIDFVVGIFIKMILVGSFILNIAFLIELILKPSTIKTQKEIKLVSEIFRNSKYMIYTGNGKLIVLFVFLIIGTILSFICLAFVLGYISNFDIGFLMFIFLLEATGLFVVCTILRLILGYCELAYNIKQIANGEELNELDDFDYENKFFRIAFENLQKIDEAKKEKIEEMMKNERLKNELITNVSHDLKTPLTSIINYVDLLKKEKIENGSVNEYVNIIDSKSQRLKKLIDDLFDASKLSAKQFKLDIVESDVVSLLKQTLGELNDKIEKSNINFVIELPNKPILLDIDGQQIWRVFDNLLNNIIKYSPEKSRAYISLEESETEVKIVMKNVSKAPLNFDANELFERFKRGDQSRTTEGSGLGLSIAKSIVELHGGNIFITIDGDLFKASVIFKKK